jgi:hypothetical protein
MKNNDCDSLQLLALVPHRDVRRSLRAWSASLFSAGLPGAWSFPWVIPLAALSRPFSGLELKSRAFMMRSAIGLSGGKITTGPPVFAALSDYSVFGPTVNIALQDNFFAFEDILVRRISPLVIGAALCQSGALPDIIRAAPNLSFRAASFRAAALANMTFRPLPSHNGEHNDFSFEWEIGKLHWLPGRVKPALQH